VRLVRQSRSGFPSFTRDRSGDERSGFVGLRQRQGAPSVGEPCFAQPSTLVFCGTAPHTRLLVRCQRKLKALFEGVAFTADSLGGFYLPHRVPRRANREEQFGVDAPTCCVGPPIFGIPLCSAVPRKGHLFLAVLLGRGSCFVVAVQWIHHAPNEAVGTLPVEHGLDKGKFHIDANALGSSCMTRVLAHRGAAHEAPENTIAAFLDARRLGADGVELDVRLSGDGAFVVHHDAAIHGIGPISECNVVDLPASVPLLSAALEACEGLVVNVEIKNHPDEPGFDPTRAVATHVVEEILALDLEAEILISSFDLACVHAAKSAGPGLGVGLLTGIGADVGRALEQAVDAGFDALHPFVLDVTEEFVRAAHGAGIAVNTWTVDAEADLVRMRDFGVDAVITDDVALARRVVEAQN
jgi:glycerophosphoryl diester phosphodiesterase